MQHDRAIALRDKAGEVARMFSRTDRGGNTMQEAFDVERIIVLGETTSAVVFNKQPTGKKAVAFFYFINSRAKPRWEYFFITYAHLASLEKVSDLLFEVEQHNFDLNFGGEVDETARFGF